MGLQRTLYKILRIALDLKAVKNGTIGNRLGRRMIRRTTRKGARKFFK